MFRSFVLVAALSLLGSDVLAQTTAFHYQGRLDKAGAPYDGQANLWFSLTDDPGAGAVLGDVNHPVVEVEAGQFSVELDFGPGVFDGSPRYLEIRVATPGDADFTVLTPRVPILPTPYAMHATSGGPSAWIDDAGDLTYGGGTVGVTGWSSPVGAGKGVFLEGGYPNHANVFAFDYDSGLPQNLLLNAPGGSVGIGTANPLGTLHVSTPNANPAVYANSATNLAATVEAHNSANGGVSLYATAPNGGRAIAGWSFGTGWAVSGDNTVAGTFGLLGTPIEGVAGFSSNASIPAGRFTNSAFGGLGLKVAGLAEVNALKITGGADLAERFACVEDVPAGTVMIIDPDRPGHMKISEGAFDPRVSGVVSGARGLAAGVVLGVEEESVDPGVAIALTGRVWVRCDDSNGPIQVGSLLTTSSRSGRAMAAAGDPRATGAVLGKAMTALEHGEGMVLVLVSLQ